MGEKKSENMKRMSESETQTEDEALLHLTWKIIIFTAFNAKFLVIFLVNVFVSFRFVFILFSSQ